jgi:hypothetical protein
VHLVTLGRLRFCISTALLRSKLPRFVGCQMHAQVVVPARAVQPSSCVQS